MTEDETSTPLIDNVRREEVLPAQIKFVQIRDTKGVDAVDRDVTRSLAEAVAAYRHVLHEHRDLDAVHDDWQEVDSVYRQLRHTEETITVPTPGRGSGSETRTVEGLQAASPNDLYRLTQAMDDIASKLGSGDDVEPKKRPVVAEAV